MKALRYLLLLATSLTTAGCQRAPSNNHDIAVVSEPSNEIAPTRPSSTASATPTATVTPKVPDLVERIAAPPSARPTGPLIVTTRPRTFVDPPLPPELNDDGGLKPLPRPLQQK